MLQFVVQEHAVLAKIMLIVNMLLKISVTHLKYALIPVMMMINVMVIKFVMEGHVLLALMIKMENALILKFALTLILASHVLLIKIAFVLMPANTA